jgi:hypothetical protein
MNIRSTLFVTIAFSRLLGQSAGTPIEAPRFWNDRDLADWATPVSGLNVRPGHYSEKDYYSAPVLRIRTDVPRLFSLTGAGRVRGNDPEREARTTDQNRAAIARRLAERRPAYFP